MVGLWLELWQKKRKTPFLSGALVRIRLEIEGNTLFGRAFVRVRAKIMKNILVARLWLVLGLK